MQESSENSSLRTPRPVSRRDALRYAAAASAVAGLGVADRNSLAGVVRAHAAAKEAGLTYRVGCRLVFSDGTPDIAAYPRDRAAFGRLTRLLTAANLRGEKGAPLVLWRDLMDWREGLLLIVVPGEPEDPALLTTLDRLVAALEAEPGTPAARALWGSEMNSIIQQLTRNGDHLVNVRADVGARLSRLDAVTAAREDLELELQTSLSGLRDVDYSTAITKMNAQMVALQAAQQSYSRIAGLTLFDYL